MKKTNTKQWVITVLPFLACVMIVSGCGRSYDPNFNRVCQELNVPKKVASVLWDYQRTRGHDCTKYFEFMRAFCCRRQAAYRNSVPKLTDPILTKSTTEIILGQPHQITEDGDWLYFFNPEQTWHLRLEFKDNTLFYTGYRQLMPNGETSEK